MSRFSTMTTNERKMQAAAICREVHRPEGIDLGKKMSVPKDVMLEELSLASNRGSLLFEKRKRRSEKYTFESIQNGTDTQISNGGTLQTESQETTDSNSLGVEHSKTPPNTPDPSAAPDPGSIAPGYGGPLKEMEPERFNSTCLPKSYHSPWDMDIYRHDPSLANSLVTHLPEPEAKTEGPRYKSFNRVATPFGGFGGKSNRSTPLFKAPNMDQNPTADPCPELQGEHALHRPTFNRVASGWAGASVPLILPTVVLDPMSIPESDDL
ncbi:myozenin-2-like isoform X2 [Esox lucius]|uniref:myozenin-2-like isoform X2 n=1 Tax=Esox lucius TaxID=8010 RepID=UPI001476F1F5|nr:myozenin-2-like isoform X2 [Esox lucius]